jgi:KUP system potassium uptake protein
MRRFAAVLQGSFQRLQQTRPLTLVTTLGVVYGDIGTSPLYVFRAIGRASGGHFDEISVLGSLSLIFWTLIIVVAVKYALVVTRASNRGEGGILALMALTRASWRGRNRYLIVCGLIGAALLYGDGIITPAISVLSAIEGLKGVSNDFVPFTMPLAAIILLALFLVQRFGTAVVGGAFGPLMLAWFVFIAALGIIEITKAPAVLAALDPTYLVRFLVHDRWAFLAILGAAFLCVTGAEAMYADMGHFGRTPIRVAWTAIVLPSLVLNYAGQTAVEIASRGSIDNPFFSLASGWLLYPAIVMSTLATVIASQAIITGAFSLTRQAIQLGWLPGMQVRQTSSRQAGQIYVPFINWAMMLATLALTVGFGNSDRLAGAYGAAVSTTMLMTTAILYRMMRVSWRWPVWLAGSLFSFFLCVDTVFFVANLTKLADGGWIPLLIGTLIFIVMTTWHTGIDAMHRRQEGDEISAAQFVRRLRDHKINRIPGKAVFLARMGDYIPPLLADHVRQMGSLHEQTAILTVRFSAKPRLKSENRVHVVLLGEGLWHLTVSFGYFENPDLVNALHRAKSSCPFDPDNAVYFGERDRVIRRKRPPRMSAWRRSLFSLLLKNSAYPPDRFNLSGENFVQISRQRAV